MSTPVYEVFAIRVGANAQRTARENFLYDACCGDPNAPMPLDYYFWVIRNEQQVIVVDTCFQPATADRRNRQMHRLPEESLRQLDIDPARVDVQLPQGFFRQAVHLTIAPIRRGRLETGVDHDHLLLVADDPEVVIQWHRRIRITAAGVIEKVLFGSCLLYTSDAADE